MVSYRFNFNRWVGAEASYGWARNTLQNFTSLGEFGVQANMHQATGDIVVRLPWSTSNLQPYVLAGGGGLIFNPTKNAGGFVPGAQSQAKAAFVYGSGADYKITKYVSARFEYRGFVYERPDFEMNSLHSGATVHTAQPSAGLGIRF